MAIERGDLFDDGQGGGAGAGNDGASGAASGTVGSTGSASTGSTGASGSGSPNPATKWEDDPRAKGFLADLQKERKARQDAATQLKEYQGQLAERERQIAALTNAKPPSAVEAEEKAIKQRFEQLYPWAAGLTQDDIEALREIKGSKTQMEAAVKHHWSAHAKAMITDVYTGIAAEVGDLTDRQKKRIDALYLTEAQNDPDFLKRHEAGDKTLVAEFIKNYLEDTAEPVRRKVTASEVGRFRAVPNGGSRSMPTSGGKPIDVNDSKAVEDALVSGFKERGGAFGRR